MTDVARGAAPGAPGAAPPQARPAPRGGPGDRAPEAPGPGGGRPAPSGGADRELGAGPPAAGIQSVDGGPGRRSAGVAAALAEAAAGGGLDGRAPGQFEAEAGAGRRADQAGGRYLPDALAQAAQAEFQRAARQLLMTPLISAAANPEGFRLVRGHLPELRDWFGRNTGWRIAEDSAVIRLNKQIVPATPTARAVACHHPARAVGRGQPFSARRYVLFCLAAAALERAEVQTTLGDLAGAVVGLAHERELGGLTFTFETRDERSDLAQAIRLLLSLGALRRVSGDEADYVQAGGDAALYDVDRRVLARLLVVGESPARLAARRAEAAVGIGQLESDLHPAGPLYTEADRNTALRRRLTIQLLEDPVCYTAELNEDEAAYFARQRLVVARRVAELTGLEPEVRAEGVAMTDREDRLTDLRMPEVGTDGHAALLIAEHLASGPPGAAGVAFDQLEGLVAGWAREYKPYWRASAREPGAAGGLVREAVAKLEALGLVRLAGGVVRALPAIRRFRFDGPRRPAATRAAPAAPDGGAAALFDLPGAAPASPGLNPSPRPEPGPNSNCEPKAAV